MSRSSLNSHSLVKFPVTSSLQFLTLIYTSPVSKLLAHCFHSPQPIIVPLSPHLSETPNPQFNLDTFSSTSPLFCYKREPTPDADSRSWHHVQPIFLHLTSSLRYPNSSTTYAIIWMNFFFCYNIFLYSRTRYCGPHIVPTFSIQYIMISTNRKNTERRPVLPFVWRLCLGAHHYFSTPVKRTPVPLLHFPEGTVQHLSMHRRGRLRLYPHVMLRSFLVFPLLEMQFAHL